jgi:hypothetical protein
VRTPLGFCTPVQQDFWSSYAEFREAGSNDLEWLDSGSSHRPAGKNEICPRCGAQITPSGLSLREIALTAVCGTLVLSMLMLACWTTEQWIERQGHRILDRMTWHEPVESWNQ